MSGLDFLFFKLLNWLYNMLAAMRLAVMSEIGMLNHIPFTPQNKGSINKQGIKISTCRLNDKMMAFFAIPMLWKKLEVTIWNPMIGKNMTIMRKPRADIAFNVWSVVKADTTSSGISSPIRNPTVVTIEATIIVSFVT